MSSESQGMKETAMVRLGIARSRGPFSGALAALAVTALAATIPVPAWGQCYNEFANCCSASNSPGCPSSSCTALVGACNSAFGDIGGGFNPNIPQWMAADGAVNIGDDILSAIEAFSNNPGNPGKTRADIEPCRLDFKINITDLTHLLLAFSSLPYPFEPGLLDCPMDPCAESGLVRRP